MKNMISVALSIRSLSEDTITLIQTIILEENAKLLTRRLAADIFCRKIQFRLQYGH